MSNKSTLIREENDTYLGKTILGSAEALQFLQMSESMLDKLCSNGFIPYFNGTDATGKNKGRLRYFKVSDLMAYMTTYFTPTVSINNFPDSVRKVS